MHFWGKILILFGSCMLLLACIASAQQPAPDESSRAIDLKNFDQSVKPTQDFYKFVNGGWMTQNPVPAELSRYGSFDEVRERNFSILHGILEESAKRTDAPKGSTWQMVGDFYATGMDSAKIESDGLKPLSSEFGAIQALKNSEDIFTALAHFQTMGIGVPFAFFASQDAKKSTDVIAQLYQSGLGLPDRDYYTKEDDNSKELRSKYAAHIQKMFELLGDDPSAAVAEAKTVVALETRLANASMTRVEQRDPEAVYHKMTVEQLSALTPNFQWKKYFDGIALPNPGNINIGQPKFLQEVDKMVKDVPVGDWQTYLRWHLIHQSAPFLSTPFVNSNFDFFGRTLNGIKELKPRWKRCLETIDGGIGEALGQLYVDKAFGGPAKARAKAMIENLRAALRDRIKALTWMSDATKQAALKKLGAFAVKVGYPDTWRDYSKLGIVRDSYVQNMMRSIQFEFDRNLHQIGKPVDRNEWGMTPPTVNAYYNPTMNEIVFPAGILQPPFYDANADDPVNYGGIGAVIGHEMTHGFDDEGRQFDAEGNLKDWWTPEDAKNYNERSAIVEKQYDNYLVLDSLHVNGKLTLGENIADLGGLTIAYAALQKAQEGKPSQEKIDGFTPEQRFFISWAQIWRQTIRPENQRVRLNTDPHSPGRWRCIGPISNLEEFVKAFELSEDSPMVRKTNERARIW